MSEGKLYLGVIKRVMEWEVLVDPGDGSKPAPIDPRLDVANHSPTGLAWGYWGSGPAQCSLAILCDAVGVERAKPLYQRFKQDKIAHLSQRAGWTMTLREILVWVERTEAEDMAARQASCDHYWVVGIVRPLSEDSDGIPHFEADARTHCTWCGKLKSDGDEG